MVIRYALLFAGLFVHTQFGSGQNRISSEPAKVTLILPADIPSQSIQVRYFMTGAFGGYGSFVKSQSGQTSYGIDASVDGQRAANLKVIVYVSGCEIVTLDIPVVEANTSRSVTCRKLATRPERGRISAALLMQEHGSAEVAVEYLAMWDHRFFGITDGPNTSFEVATTVPGNSGGFEALVPDLRNQKNLGEGEFRWILRNKITGNLIANLNPTEDGFVLSNLP